MQMSYLVGESTPEGSRPTVAAYHRVPAVPNVEQWRSLVAAYFPPHAVEGALRVILGPTPPNPSAPQGCPTGESGGNALADSGMGDFGGMQIRYESHKDKLFRVTGSYNPTLLFIPEVNVAVGALVYEAAGRTFLPWSCRP